jgi:hypothetical protein
LNLDCQCVTIRRSNALAHGDDRSFAVFLEIIGQRA